MSEYKERRPLLCLDQKCTPFWWNGSEVAHEQGYSWECVGKLCKPHTFVWNEVTHVNHYCHCLYTPLKGISKFLMNATDARGTRDIMSPILRDAEPLVCCGCGGKSFLGEYWEIGKKGYCPFCMIRLGKVEWDGKCWVFKG